MKGYGRGHPHPGWAEITKASKAARLDAGSDGRGIRAGQKLFGGCGARKKKRLRPQFGNHCYGFRADPFQIFYKNVVFGPVGWEDDVGALKPDGMLFFFSHLKNGAQARES